MPPPCVIFEDEHLLVANKPAGVNTHAPSPYAGEGLYDWLRHREARWASLAIIHRLDKETSGVMVFGKTPLANRSLTQQFTQHTVRKRYFLLTDRPAPKQAITVRSVLARSGEKYVSRPVHPTGSYAETLFRPLKSAFDEGGWAPDSGLSLLAAEPLTGRTHQIRVHAAQAGFPILGDTLYSGTPAARVFLHAAKLTLRHPATGQEVTFDAPSRESLDLGCRNLAFLSLRAAFIEPELTNAYRLLHGASDGWPGWYVERLGDYLLSTASAPLQPEQKNELEALMEQFGARGAYHRILSAQSTSGHAQSAPQFMLGAVAPERFVVRENGLRFELSFCEGCSVGLFLDQRDNRRRLLSGHVAAGFDLAFTEPSVQPRPGPDGVPAQAHAQPSHVLNLFAYTCGFSVCAAKAGARTTNLDLSKNYLEWGKRNFELNQLDPREHQFITGDVFDWLRRLAKQGRQFDLILLDPPTFSRSKSSGVFRAESDYSKLVTAALPVLSPGGVLFAATNARQLSPSQFLEAVKRPISSAQREVLKVHYAPQPPDFPISRNEPAHLKTVWMAL